MKTLFGFGLYAVASATALGLVAGQAAAEDAYDKGNLPIYVSIFGGLNHTNASGSGTVSGYDTTSDFKFKTGYLIGGAVGMRYNDNIRVELELSHLKTKAKSVDVHFPASSSYDYSLPLNGKLSNTYLLGNVWFDLPTNSAFTPYVGGGLGYNWAKAEAYGKASGFAVQGGLGVNFAVSDNMSIDAGYRLKYAPTMHVKGTGPLDKVELINHTLQVGLTFKF